MNDSNRKQTFPCTDMSNMERFLQHHQESIRFAGQKANGLSGLVLIGKRLAQAEYLLLLLRP